MLHALSDAVSNTLYRRKIKQVQKQAEKTGDYEPVKTAIYDFAHEKEKREHTRHIKNGLHRNKTRIIGFKDYRPNFNPDRTDRNIYFDPDLKSTPFRALLKKEASIARHTNNDLFLRDLVLHGLESIYSEDRKEALFAAIEHCPALVKKYMEDVRRDDPALFGQLKNFRNENGQTLLHVAAKAGMYDAVAYLLEEAEFDPSIEDKDGKTAFDYAIYGQHTRTIKAFTDRINDRKTIMRQYFSAVATGKLQSVKQLVEDESLNIDINAKNDEGSRNAAIHYAVYNDDLEMIEYIAENGGRLNARNGNGSIAIHFAKSVEAISLLRDKERWGTRRSYLNARNKKGQTPAMYSGQAGRDNIEVFDELEKQGANMRIEDHAGRKAARPQTTLVQAFKTTVSSKAKDMSGYIKSAWQKHVVQDPLVDMFIETFGKRPVKATAPMHAI